MPNLQALAAMDDCEHATGKTLEQHRREYLETLHVHDVNTSVHSVNKIVHGVNTNPKPQRISNGTS